jgi:predicted ATPase
MLHLAAEVMDGFPDGAWLVELAPITDPGLVPQAVARALGVPDTGRPELDSVLDFLREKDLLLLLDNCEHVIDAAADLSDRLLLECRSLRILATSREALAVSGEASVHVPSLGLPGGRGHDAASDVLDPGVVATADAVRLFVDRASATLPGVRLDTTTAGPVVEICRRLDGIPLALELAAARVSVLSVAEIAQGLGDRFRLLTGGRRTAVPRQQTLQALIDWSWDLLTETDQRLLRRLSVFAASWTLEAAAEITADAPGTGAGSAADGSRPTPSAASTSPTPAVRIATLDGLGRLVDRSLVVVDHGAETRYHMLETIRQYANEKLVASGEAPLLRDRHLDHFRGMVLEVSPALSGADMVRCLDRLDTELDDVRTALDGARDPAPELFVEMIAAVGMYWRFRSVGTEGMDLLEEAIAIARALPEPSPETRAARAGLLARLLATTSIVGAATNRRTDAVHAWADESVELAEAGGDRWALGLAQTARFLAAVLVGERFPGEFVAQVGALVEIAEELDAWSTLAPAASAIGIHLAATDPEAAVRWLERGEEAARRRARRVPSIVTSAAL